MDKSRLKRPNSMHTVLIPRIATGQWRRIMSRRTDCYLKIDWEPAWSTNQHFEPLLMFIALPHFADRPFGNRKAKLLEKFQGVLQKCRLPSTPNPHKGNLLREFLASTREVPPL
jgi:hypothetical protein